jgi:20S proteasome alpha/beta subunit
MWRFLVSFIYFLSSLPAIHSSSAAREETLIGIKGRDFIIIGADSSARSSISLTSTNIDKIRVLIDPFPTKSYPTLLNANRQQTIVAAVAGESADADRLLGLLAAHALMVEFDSGLGCDIQCLYPHDKKTLIDKSPLYLDSPAGLDADSLSHLARSEIASHLRSSEPYQVCLLIAGMVRCVRYSSKDQTGSQKKKIPDSFAQTIQRQVRNAVHLTTLQEQQKKHLESDLISSDEAPINKDVDSTSVHTSDKENVRDGDEEGLFLAPKLYWLDEYGSRSSLEYGAHGFSANFALSIIDRVYRPDLSRLEATTLIKDCFQQLRSRFVINSPSSPCIKCIDAQGCHIIL